MVAGRLRFTPALDVHLPDEGTLLLRPADTTSPIVAATSSRIVLLRVTIAEP